MNSKSSAKLIKTRVDFTNMELRERSTYSASAKH